LTASLALSLTLPGFCSSVVPQRFLVQVPVADLRSSPRPYEKTGEQDPEEETQVLYGEPLWADGETGDWWHVEVPWQPCFHCTQSWGGYPGWIRKEWVAAAPPSWSETPRHPETRQCVVREAGRFLGTPYLWGGLSGPDVKGASTRTGVDCSGLVHLAYRFCGYEVPRDARDQKKKARSVSAANLVPGDLVFVADAENPEVAHHVSIYAGGEDMIEAPSTGLRVRRIDFKSKFGKSLHAIVPDVPVDGKVISFGHFP